MGRLNFAKRASTTGKEFSPLAGLDADLRKRNRELDARLPKRTDLLAEHLNSRPAATEQTRRTDARMPYHLSMGQRCKRAETLRRNDGLEHY